MTKHRLATKPLELNRVGAFPLVKCAFHPEETLTNFCLAQECFLPLCPRCIKLHTEEHGRVHTHGQFETLHECFKQVEKSYLDYIQETKLLMQSVQKSAQKKTGLQKQVRQVYKQSRAKILEQVNRILECYEDQLQNQLHNQMRELSQQIEDVENSVAWILGSSRKALQGIRNSQAAQVLIQFYSEEANKIQSLLEISSKQVLGARQQGSSMVQLALNPGQVAELKLAIYKCLDILPRISKQPSHSKSRDLDLQQTASGRKWLPRREDSSQTSLQGFDLRRFREERRYTHNLG